VQLLNGIKTLNGPRVRRVSLVEEEKIYGGKGAPKSQVLSSEWKTEGLSEYERGGNKINMGPTCFSAAETELQHKKCSKIDVGR